MPGYPEEECQVMLDRYKVLIEDKTIGFFETNTSGKLVFFNDAFCNMVGRSSKELINRNLSDLIDTEDFQPTNSSFNGVQNYRYQTKPIFLRIKREDTDNCILQVSQSPIIDACGQPNGSRGIARDVTVEMQTHAKLAESTLKIEHLYAKSRLFKGRRLAFLEFLPIPLLVQNMDHSVAYLNPAYETTFGWTREDLELDPFAPIPAAQIEKTLTGKAKLLTNSVFYGLETKRLTKDGRELDVIYDGSALYDHHNQPNGLITTMRDITQSKKDARITQVLFKIAKTLHHYSDLKSRLIFIAREAQALMNVRNAYILLLEHENNNIYSRTGVSENSVFSDTLTVDPDSFDPDSAEKILFSGHSYINNDISDESQFKNWRLNSSGPILRNMMAAPLRMEKQIMGVMVMSNRVDGNFDQDDMALLTSIAIMVVMPIENARMNESLRQSYEEIQMLSQAKDRIIDRLSHELRTPISVLAASFEMLASGYGTDNEVNKKIIDRCKRNIERIIDMQYKLEDIIIEPDRHSQQSLTALLELCTEELEALIGMESSLALAGRIRNHIDRFFSRQALRVERISLHRFVTSKIIELKSMFVHRLIDFQANLEQDVGIVHLPSEILDKIITGLIRNAIEYTPDGGRVRVTVQVGDTGPELVVSDTGIGITNENIQLINGNYFTIADTYQYATGNPFDFNAGGRGLDLLRIHVFSEHYPLKLSMESQRCQYIPTSKEKCPGKIVNCIHCDSAEHCYKSGGTTFTVKFARANNNNNRL